MDFDEKNKRSKKIEEKKIRKKYALNPAPAVSPAKKFKTADKGKVDFNA